MSAWSALPSLTNNTMNVGFVNSSPKCHSRFGLGPVIPVPYENGRFVRSPDLATDSSERPLLA